MSEILSLAELGETALHRAVGALRAGELVVVPTDTVYGLAADAFSREATRAVFDVKQRARSMPLPILVSRPRQAWALASTVPPAAAELVAAYWPGPLTLVLPEADGLEWDLGETKASIAVRMPDHEHLVRLLEMTGPLAVTSANLSGEPTPRSVEDIAEKLGDRVAIYLDGGPAPGDTPSTIVDLTGKDALVIREGVVPVAEIERLLAGAR